MPEVWNGQVDEWVKGLTEGYLEAVEGDGQVGKISFYVPAFVAERDSTLISFHGLGGEDNRHKLAATFHRPTTWKDYCREVSLHNCTSPNAVAQRYPTSDEEGMYYSGPAFIGHFRPTAQNNCTAFPNNCTGHIVAPPCTWSTNLDAQLYWNNIALESNGPSDPNGAYSYGSMIQIYRAANATKSNVIMWWWKPDPTVEEFRGTSAEFQQILLPEATESCSQERIKASDRCSLDPWARRGDPLGSCDSEAHALQIIMSTSVRQALPAAYKSPAYEAIKNLKISDLEINTLLKAWVSGDQDTWGYDPRKAVCDWVTNNLDVLDSFVPPGYPRVLTFESHYDEPWFSAFYALGGLSILLVIMVSVTTYRYRNTWVFVVAQPFFLALILSGFLMTSVSAIFFLLEPSKSSCVSTAWFVSLGFTLQLVPLLVKIAAITRIDSSAKKMKRVLVKPKTMIAAVASVVGVVLVYLIVWTIVDPPTLVEDRVVSPVDDRVIEVAENCDSQSYYWLVVCHAWEALLLICATVLAVQSRNVAQQLNESKSLGVMVYVHFFFKVLRLIVYFLDDIFPPNIRAAMYSFLWSTDTIVALGVYFGPKLAIANSKSREGGDRRSTAFRTSLYPSDNTNMVAKYRQAAELAAAGDCFSSDNGRSRNNSSRVESDQHSATSGIQKMMTFSNESDCHLESVVEDEDDSEIDDEEQMPPKTQDKSKPKQNESTENDNKTPPKSSSSPILPPTLPPPTSSPPSPTTPNEEHSHSESRDEAQSSPRPKTCLPGQADDECSTATQSKEEKEYILYPARTKKRMIESAVQDFISRLPSTQPVMDVRDATDEMQIRR
jgi:hypothetical protein